ncbi:MAG: GWxTD domain-containing protein [Candidatus Aminicenantes bacterium]|nr:GWxTD domain-containing protein [Candidatus Aminicenantes bacterium]
MTIPPLEAAAERFLEQISYIITPQEEKIFREIPPEDRAKFIEEFWRRRDPDPETEVNEFRQAYYTRMAIADKAFKAGIPGWKTDRGRIYILLGPPTDVIKKTMGDTPTEFGESRRELSSNILEEGTITERPSEIWVYNQYPDYFSGPLRLVFVATEGTKDYKLVSDITIKPMSMISYYSFDPDILYYQRVAEVTDQSSDFPIAGLPDFSINLEKLFKDEGGNPLATFVIAIPFRGLTFVQDGNKWRYFLKFSIECHLSQSKEVFRSQREYSDSHDLETLKAKFRQNESLIDTWTIPVNRGDNRLYFRLEDQVNKQSLRKWRLIKVK